MPQFTVTKVTIDGADLVNNPVIKQLREYRLLQNIKQVKIVQDNPSLFSSNSHVRGLETGRQKETSLQIQAYAKSIWLKEITIRL